MGWKFAYTFPEKKLVLYPKNSLALQTGERDMSRPTKIGLDYFPMDTQTDDKFELIEAKHGIVGFGVVIKLFQSAYREYGYFYPWTEREQLLFSRRVNVDINEVNAIINDAVTYGIFDKGLFEKHVLTSHGMQKRFIEATLRRKELTLYSDLLLVNVNIIPVNVGNNPRHVEFLLYIGTQSKVKERIEENTEEPAVAEAPALFEESADDEFPDDIPFDLPEVTPAPPPAPKPKAKPEAPRDPLRDALAESFKAKVPEYASPAKENANLLKLTSAIRRKAQAAKLDEEEAAQGCLEIFWKLHESGKQFYSDFTPSKMLAAFESLWAEYLKSVEANDLSWIDEAEARCAREGASA